METAEARLARAREALAGVQRRVGTTRERWEAPALPLAPMLDQVMPQGLRRGQVVSVVGSTSLMLALAAAASEEGSWTAAVGMPSLGVVAAARRGLDLARLALMPHPGAQAATVAGACVDGMDVVLLGPRLALSDADRRRLASRARERGSVILAEGPWTGAHVALTAVASRWHGLGAGDGRLRGRELTVRVEERRGGLARLVTLPIEGASVGVAPVRRGAEAPSMSLRALGGAA
ncbi:hypothetical protein [Demequina mangrovi]|uniref:Protein RecA n=1 Tax=Demequina mangrovi TaxID=1043493 RepID=A0A1H7AUQ6_9MICO|nr:hypothetical protein [Demequina mangrovi]SEJ69319.1 hypothetical protein SAMN05421637_2704 [Demequina mangrovi]